MSEFTITHTPERQKIWDTIVNNAAMVGLLIVNDYQLGEGYRYKIIDSKGDTLIREASMYQVTNYYEIYAKGFEAGKEKQ